MTRHLIAAAAAALAAGPALAQKEISVALDWTPNTNHVGLYVAEAEGYYDAAGLDVTILPYADTSSGTLVANGVGEFGVLSALGFYTQRAAGADLQAVFAVMQRETGRLVFDGTRDDIRTPADLDGLTYAGFGTGWEETLIATMIRAAGGEGAFETVTLGTSAYEALESGRVDFTLEVYTWEGVNAKLRGREQGSFRYADYGVPEGHTTFIGARQEWLDANPGTAEAFLRATRRGYAFAVENPQAAADILIEATGDVLDNEALVRGSMEAIVEGGFMATEDGEVGLIDSAKVAATGTFLFEAGILRDEGGAPLENRPDFSGWVTNRYLQTPPAD